MQRVAATPSQDLLAGVILETECMCPHPQKEENAELEDAVAGDGTKIIIKERNELDKELFGDAMRTHWKSMPVVVGQ